jgi:lipid-binding SYLF domain-containing protein
MFRTKALFAAPVLAAALFMGTGCETAPKTEAKRENLVDEAQVSLKGMKDVDPALASFMDRGYAYAIFPNVGKGGFVAGGAYGRGSVYEQGRFIGYADVKQGTVGLQAGGQNFSELIVFENKAALDRFTNNEFGFSANASAIAIKPGVGKSTNFEKGVAVFTQPKGGLMVEAAIGGQQFTFKSATSPNNTVGTNTNIHTEHSEHTEVNVPK